MLKAFLLCMHKNKHTKYSILFHYFYHCVYWARDNQRELFMCFIDYKKVFDCVDHQRLCNTLKGMGEYQ